MREGGFAGAGAGRVDAMWVVADMRCGCIYTVMWKGSGIRHGLRTNTGIQSKKLSKGHLFKRGLPGMNQMRPLKRRRGAGAATCGRGRKQRVCKGTFRRQQLGRRSGEGMRLMADAGAATKTEAGVAVCNGCARTSEFRQGKLGARVCSGHAARRVEGPRREGGRTRKRTYGNMVEAAVGATSTTPKVLKGHVQQQSRGVARRVLPMQQARTPWSSAQRLPLSWSSPRAPCCRWGRAPRC